MGKKKAAPQKEAPPTLEQMVKMRFDLMDEMDRLAAACAKLTAPILAEMKAQGLKESPAYMGRAFRHQKTNTCDYKQEAYDLATEKGVIGLFTPDPNITQPKVAAAYKAEKIDLETFTALESFVHNKALKETLVKFEVKA